MELTSIQAREQAVEIASCLKNLILDGNTWGHRSQKGALPESGRGREIREILLGRASRCTHSPPHRAATAVTASSKSEKDNCSASWRTKDSQIAERIRLALWAPISLRTRCWICSFGLSHQHPFHHACLNGSPSRNDILPPDASDSRPCG